MDNHIREIIAGHWNNETRKNNKSNPITRLWWWESPTIIRHINHTICGEFLEGWNAGPIKLLRNLIGERKLDRALSVGCGNGSKEMVLLENNLVDNFICFDYSEERIKEGRINAEKRGLKDRIIFINEDFFESEYANQNYDMIFWDNSLHHMPDAFMAVQKSYEILNSKGIFFCNDFVGKSKFQWSDMELAIVNGIRISLSDTLFCNGKGGQYQKFICRPDIKAMNKLDPSEAADSASIIPAIMKIIPHSLIIPTGGLIYNLCLSEILSNIEEDSELLNYLLELDDNTIKMGMDHYAFILAEKHL